MISIHRKFILGISPHLLYTDSMRSPLHHVAAVSRACQLSGYESLELFFPMDKIARETEFAIIRDSGKQVNYNFPVDFQLEGSFNPGSPDKSIRTAALDLALQHVDFACEIGSPVIAMTSGPDAGLEERPAVLERFAAFCAGISERAKASNIRIAIEAVERGVFKNLLLGPTAETSAFVMQMQADGYENITVMIDTAHLPLMGETFSPALDLSLQAGIGHVHIGNSVMRPNSPYYGHQHPPIGIQDGEYDTDDVACFFAGLINAGYFSNDNPADLPLISLEMLPYPGVSPATSALMAYEKICTSWEMAVTRCHSGGLFSEEQRMM